MRGKNFFLVLFWFTGILPTIFSQEVKFKFKEGDFLFQDLDCGDLCTAIEKVTPGYKNYKFSHIGLVYKDNKRDFYVIEAIGKGVCLTPLDSFLLRSTDADNNPKIMVGRIKQEYSYLTKKAINKALKLLNYPYDDEFIINNNQYYCSELIYEVFKYANKGKDFFILQPMTFKDPETKEFFPAWVDYYRTLKKPIPEGKPGINPGQISLSNKIHIIEVLGIIN